MIVKVSRKIDLEIPTIIRISSMSTNFSANQVNIAYVIVQSIFNIRIS